MKKRFVFALMAALFVCLVPVFAIATIKIPVSAGAALALAPVDSFPLLSVTVQQDTQSDGMLFILDGMDQMPLREKKRYQKGVFTIAQQALDGLQSVKGREEEPFAILLSEEEDDHVALIPSGKYAHVEIQFSPLWKTVKFRYSFSNGDTYTFDKEGNLVDYVSSSVYVQYAPDGFMKCFQCGDNPSVEYDAVGKMTSIISYKDKQNHWYSWRDSVWRNEQYDKCDQPIDFSEKLLPEIVLYPDEDVALITARAEAVAACIPDPAMITGPDVSAFPPLPVVAESVDDQGNLWITVTGLEAWGLATHEGQHVDFFNGYQGVRLIKSVGERDALTIYVPAECVPKWRKDCSLSGIYAGVWGNLVYGQSIADRWSFLYGTNPDEYCEFVLGESPFLAWSMHLVNDEPVWQNFLYANSHEERYEADGKEIIITYLPDGQLIDISADARTEVGWIFGEYDHDGQLVELQILDENTTYHYNVLRDEWLMGTNVEGSELTPCEPVEGFDISEWLFLPPNPNAE